MAAFETTSTNINAKRGANIMSADDAIAIANSFVSASITGLETKEIDDSEFGTEIIFFNEMGENPNDLKATLRTKSKTALDAIVATVKDNITGYENGSAVEASGAADKVFNVKVKCSGTADEALTVTFRFAEITISGAASLDIINNINTWVDTYYDNL